jgi:PBP1b-binding outer membrane lipoprotein LpoB
LKVKSIKVNGFAMAISRILFAVIMIVFLISCGNKKRPTGGKKDTIKPQIISVSPDEFSDISGKIIEVVFSKPIERNSILSGLYIYPPIAKKKFKWDKNILQIKINEELEPNTNYFFTFTQSIAGEHKNKLDQDYYYIFKHGKLNEKKLSGTFAFEDEEDIGEPIHIDLFSADSIRIFSKTINEPNFNFEYLNEKEQILRAFADIKKNKKYDYGTEPYFEEIIPKDKIINLDPFLAYEDTIKPDVKSAKAVYSNRIDVGFTESVKSVSNIEIFKSDSLKTKVVLNDRLLIDKDIMLIADFSDSLKYNIVFRTLADKKNNITDSCNVFVSGITKQDSFPPEVISIIPRDGSTVKTLLPEISIEFDEIVHLDEFKLYSSEKADEIALKMIDFTEGVYNFIPSKELSNFSSYYLFIDVSDTSGNKIVFEKLINIIPIVRN